MSDETDTEQVVMLQRLNPEKRDEYVEAHQDVPQSVSDAMEGADVKEYRLYLREEIVVGVMKLPDLERFEEEYGSDPANEAWEERVAAFKQSGVDPDEMEIPIMDEIWTFTADGD
jgi:L-rhamnose mutarotase